MKTFFLSALLTLSVSVCSLAPLYSLSHAMESTWRSAYLPYYAGFKMRKYEGSSPIGSALSVRLPGRPTLPARPRG